jgi:hypothetical protein
MKVTRVDKITIEDVERTYRGDLGCACGCGGDYFDTDNEEHKAEIEKHIKYVNSRIKEMGSFGNGVEVTNPSYTKATRLYFKEGVRVYKTMFNSIEMIKEGN